MFTHKRVQLKAKCIQWDGSNTEEILKWFPTGRVHKEFLIVHPVGRIWTLEVGYWVVEQENGEVRMYSPAKFQLLYEVL